MSRRTPCLPSIGEPCGDCHRCRDTSGSEIRHCDGCGEDYDPFEESHVGHVATDDEVLSIARDVTDRRAGLMRRLARAEQRDRGQ